MGQSILDLSDSVSGMDLTAAKAVAAAMDGPQFKAIEDDWVTVNKQDAAATDALGTLEEFQPDNPQVAAATSDLIQAAESRFIPTTWTFTQYALQFERDVNRRNIAVRRYKLGRFFYALGGGYSASANSSTYGHIDQYGNYDEQTTTLRLPQPFPQLDTTFADESIEQRQEFLVSQFQPLAMMSHQWFPMVNSWIAACCAAGELTPPPTLPDKIKMANRLSRRESRPTRFSRCSCTAPIFPKIRLASILACLQPRFKIAARTRCRGVT